MINKIIKNIVHKLLNILDKRENNFYHKFTYVSKDEVPQEERIGVLRIYEDDEWTNKGIWIGKNNEYYNDVLKITERE